jgi:hypothetical protein
MNADLTISVAAYFRMASRARVSDLHGLARKIIGRNPRNNAEIVDLFAAFIEDGYIVTQGFETAIKGCPGGRPRPGSVNIQNFVVTKAGAAYFAAINAEQDAIKLAAELPRRCELLAQFAAMLAAAHAEDVEMVKRQLCIIGDLNKCPLAKIEDLVRALTNRAEYRKAA